MKLLFSSDLHGKLVLYEKLINIIKKIKPDILILGGDLLPKSGYRDKLFMIQYDFIKKYLLEFFNKIQKNYSLETFIMLGNDDFLSHRKELCRKEYSNLYQFIDNSKLKTKSGWEIIGFNLVPETPYSIKDLERRDCLDDSVQFPSVYAVTSTTNSLKVINSKKWFSNKHSLAEELEMLPQIAKPKRTIFVTHAPPYGTALDIMSNGEHVGSKAIRKYIETYQPIISLSGHIHESFSMSGNYATKIGKSICLGPGQIHYPNLDAILIDDGNSTLSIKHTCENAPITQEGKELLNGPQSY